MTEHRRRHHRKSSVSMAAGYACVSILLTLILLVFLLPRLGTGSAPLRISTPDVPLKLNQLVAAQGELLPIPVQGDGESALHSLMKLDDRDLVAPKPNALNYGAADSPAELDWLPIKAGLLMDGQPLYFGADRNILPGTQIKYYLDDTIAVVVWKERVNVTTLTFAEVKIADASQFRRFLAGGRFGADTQFTTTEMAQSVNAVLASSGDFYKFRYNGVVVYDGSVRRVNTNKADTCYINDAGDLLFTYQNHTMSQEEAQRFVDDNHVRFSLTFGPVLVDNGVRCEPSTYELGEVNDYSPRAALCQLGKLHYLLVTANAEGRDSGEMDMHQFAERIAQTGCEKAYALDGGQTAALALDGQLVNSVLFGQQRSISDIIYFATAIREGG